MVSYSKLIHLSHTISSSTPTWTGSCGYHEEVFVGFDEADYKAQGLTIFAGLGTHLDAPAHFDPAGLTVGEIPLENLMLSACVIDVHKKAKEDYFIQLEDIYAHEELHGSIKSCECVCFYTGWSKKYDNSDAYRSVDSEGNMHFPGISEEVGEYLYDNGIQAIGIDTLSPDGSNTDFPLHHLFLKNGRLIVENINNLDLCPPNNWTIGIFSPPFLGATEAPVRLVGFCP